METGKRSSTSDGSAISRALHQIVDDKPLVLVDSIAPLIIDISSKRYANAFDRRDHPFFKHARSSAVARSRYAEDCLGEAVENGVRQYLLLGAGMDSFAYRQPPWAQPLHICEVDHPATQEWKKKRLGLAGLSSPANLMFVPVNFESESLDENLRRSGFDFSAPTFVAWLGVTPYLTEQAIDKTLRIVQALPRGTEIVFTFNAPLESLSATDAELAAAVEARVSELGEPQISKFLPQEMRIKLFELGFSQAVHFDPDQVDERYFKGRRDGLKASRSRHLMLARV
jgi:methyltransferase (TIGR00027 family)